MSRSHSRPAAKDQNQIPGPRPLYLLDDAVQDISTRGPAFYVQRAHRAAQRFPFHRVSRVISRLTVHWLPDAIHACLKQAIPLLYVDGAGRPVGFLHPARNACGSELARVLEESLAHPEGCTRYYLWRKSQRMDTIRTWHRRQTGPDKLAWGALRELIRVHVYQPHEEPDEDPDQFPYSRLHLGAISGIVSQSLEYHGVPVRHIAHGGQLIEIAADLTELGALHLALACTPAELLRKQTQPCTERVIQSLDGVHRHEHALGLSIHRWLGNLHAVLLRALEQTP